jgi:hypothetical protein
VDKIILSRKDLYDLVWSQPILTLSKKYEITGSGLRKICVKMNVPLPKAGHWQRIQHKKPVLVKSLPSEYSGENQIELFLRTENKGPNPDTKEVPIKQVKKGDIKRRSEFRVPSQLKNPDPLIVAAKSSLSSDNPRYSRYRGTVTTRDDQIHIRVAPSNIDRALRFMDAFIKLLKSRSYSIKVNYKTTYAVIQNQEIEISLKEKLKIIKIKENDWTRNDYEPTGILAFRLEGSYPKEWKDGPASLEEQLSTILEKLEEKAGKLKAEKLEREKWHQEYLEKQRIAKELKEHKELEAKAFTNLLDQAQKWQQARILREYIHEVEAKANEGGSLTKELKNWLIWAKQRADEYDPLTKEEGILVGFPFNVT